MLVRQLGVGWWGQLFIHRKDFILIFWHFVVVLYICGPLLSIPGHEMDRISSCRIPSSGQFLLWMVVVLEWEGWKKSWHILLLFVSSGSWIFPSFLPLLPCLQWRSPHFSYLILTQKHCFSEAATFGPRTLWSHLRHNQCCELSSSNLCFVSWLLFFTFWSEFVCLSSQVSAPSAPFQPLLSHSPYPQACSAGR